MAFTKRHWLYASVGLVVLLCVSLGGFLVWRVNQSVEPETVYVLPDPNPERAEILKRLYQPRPSAYLDTPLPESSALTKALSSNQGGDGITEAPSTYHDTNLTISASESQEGAGPLQPESPFGFGPYPEVPPDYSGSVIWLEDMPAEIDKYGSKHIKAVELMDRVLIKLWNQGRYSTSAMMTDEGIVYPSYSNTVYVTWKYDVDEEGNPDRYAGTVYGYQGMPDSVLDDLHEGIVPPGITVLDYDSNGIDPYNFLNLNH